MLVNSFPKSGTHLLLQIARGLPGVVHYGSFIASTPSLTLRQRDTDQVLRMIRRIPPGEVVCAHMFYDPAFGELLESMNVYHLFIYRDLRDVAVSEAYYLTRMNRWHRLHDYFARTLRSQDQRLRAVISGTTEAAAGIAYPDIGERFRKYAGWLECSQVLAVRFEELRSDDRELAVRRIVEGYARRRRDPLQVGDVTARCQAMVRPERSHTFRRGTSGRWRQAFSDEHSCEMQRVAGDLLVSLGYTWE